MDNPISSLEKLSKPLTKLVKVIAKGIGTLYAPFGTVRQAKADAKAKIIHANIDVDVSCIKNRAQSRLNYREAVRQENIELIASQAALELPDKVSDESLNDDWVIQFFDHAQDVCDEDMQKLWARILAGEVTSPGSYSKRTLQFLKTLDKREANSFSALCSLALKNKEKWLFIFHDKVTSNELKNKVGDGDWINHFISIGLLSSEVGMPSPSELSGLKVQYFNEVYFIEGPKKTDAAGTNRILEKPCIVRNFSVIGQQLAQIAGATPVDEFIEKLSESLNSQKLPVSFSKENLEDIS